MQNCRIATGRAEGRPPRLVYLHGLGCTGSRDWPPVAAAPALSGCAWLWIDLLGFGQSDRPREFSYDLADQAAILEEVLACEPDPLALVGHSMGGTLAVLLAERLIARGRPPAALLLAEAPLRPADAGMSARAAAKPESRFVAAWPRWVQAFPSPFYQADLRLADPVAFHRSACSLVRHSADMLQRFVKLSVPRKGYIVGGRSEPAAQETARLVQAAGITVERVEGSGHGFSEDDPIGFAAAIARFHIRPG